MCCAIRLNAKKRACLWRNVRKQDITVEGEFTYNSMRLELLIDLDDLLRDGGVLRIGEWDANGTFFFLKEQGNMLYCLKDW
jgi:hypothetical protein